MRVQSLRGIRLRCGVRTSSGAYATIERGLGPDESRDEVLVEELADLINAAYAVGEAGLWLEGTTRTGPGEIAEAIRSGGVLAAGLEGRLVGCAYLRPLDAHTADLGVGYEVVRSAPFEQVAAHLASQLAVPCEFLIFRKPLAGALGGDSH